MAKGCCCARAPESGTVALISGAPPGGCCPASAAAVSTAHEAAAAGVSCGGQELSGPVAQSDRQNSTPSATRQSTEGILTCTGEKINRPMPDGAEPDRLASVLIGLVDGVDHEHLNRFIPAHQPEPVSLNRTQDAIQIRPARRRQGPCECGVCRRKIQVHRVGAGKARSIENDLAEGITQHVCEGRHGDAGSSVHRARGR